MAKRKAAILGSSGMIGQRFAWMLKGHPYFEVMSYCASDRSEGKSMADVWRLSDLEVDDALQVVGLGRLEHGHQFGEDPVGAAVEAGRTAYEVGLAPEHLKDAVRRQRPLAA